MSDERQERLPEPTGRHLAPDTGAARHADDSPFVDTSLFDDDPPPRRGHVFDDSSPFDEDSPFVDTSLFKAAARRDAARREPAPRRREVSARGDEPKRGDTSLREEAPAQDAAPKRSDARKRKYAPKRRDRSKRADEPKREEVPKHGDEPRQEEAPEREDAPAPEIVPRRRRTETKRSGRKQSSRAERRAGESRAARRRRKRFKTFLLVYLVILGVCTGALQLRLWLALDHSQAQMDQAAAEKSAKVAQEKALYEAPQRTFEQWLESQSPDYWADLWYASHQGNDMEPREWLCTYFDELFSPGGYQAYKAEGFSSTAPVYLIKKDQAPVARVSLTGSDLNWTVSNVELLLAPDKNITITVPRSCRVTFNGRQLDPQSMQAAESQLDYEDLREQLQEPVTWLTYSAEGLMAEPEITVEPPNGCKVYQNDDGVYMLTMDADVSRYIDLTERFTDAFLEYYMNGYHDTRYYLNELLSFVYSDTQAYHDIYSTYDSVSWSTYYRTKDTTITVADEAIVWANNCFSIDVSYTAKGTVETDEVLEFADATMRVFFLRTDSGDGYYISHFEAV